MGRAENKVELRLRHGIEARDGLCLKFTSSRSGVPDRIVILNGQTIFVELKAPNGVLSRLQEYRINEMRQAGADVRVLRSTAEVDDFLDERDQYASQIDTAHDAAQPRPTPEEVRTTAQHIADRWGETLKILGE